MTKGQVEKIGIIKQALAELCQAQNITTRERVKANNAYILIDDLFNGATVEKDTEEINA